MLDPRSILPVLKDEMGIHPAGLEITPLQGDASNRFYYRLRYLESNRPATLIVMELAEPEAIKASEEAVSASTVQVDELPFINVLNHLAKADVAVPKLYHYDRPAGLLFLEDLGDRTLEIEMTACTPERAMQYYRLALGELAKIQGPATRTVGPACIASGRSFDVPLLMWEFDHFLEYGIETRMGIKIRPADREVIRGEFLKISEILSAEPKVFTHRDFHSRNLMIHQDRIRLLDFQDALMGPAVYDLASLLKDSYVVLEEGMVDALIEHYRGIGPAVPSDRSDFRRRFDLMSVQRNLKAAGRFVYIAVVKKKRHLLPYVPQTLAYVGRNLERYPELKRLREALIPYVDELRVSS